MSVDSIGTARRWSLLAIALAATTCAQVFINGVAFLIPALQAQRGLDLAAAASMSAMPGFGLVVTLIAWGYVVDRLGERFVLTVGSALIAAAAFAAASTQSLVAMGTFLFLGGMAAASSNSASGRLVVGWFPPDQRGLVMGIRQTATPLGVGLGALVIPRLAESQGVAAALLFPAIVCAVSAVVCLVAVIDPPRAPRSEAPAEHLANPYRGSWVLWRIHAVSVLLVVPQAVVWTFTLVWLMTAHGWSAASAGTLVTGAQLLGAAGRIVAGHWSDRVGKRLQPIRAIAAAAAASMGLLALTDWLGSPISVALMVIASVITVSDNGLAFTAVAEIAGPYWSGRALGTQNTSQHLTSAAAAPVFGALIGVAGYPAAFAVSAVLPLLAIPLVPREDSSSAARL
ncbi:sugar phosphate permease [Mycolicibacterium phlei]|jgi:sugar phosphate permease|uniref:MFS transporter n=1 Tax=Mycolicibacterium phlei DSM 43239 = CCUG 21000 TaxID=1226750 RepID=A0A5N5V4Y3_MYCPH|nr:MFS transporter [Mycolicibacterium phlei]VEG08990.1 sugar phosphate permease [Mycobacteroides chelonae]AMO60873.1 Hexuronate transporter [Mycolicibacterium phlei]EID12471.1 sugar phosphate permease [Mycolicibacterium phlei RIVM601174]KAB7756846.1 MFS transporter [Mycolicibacterium phlei DSM 43239 = CCUG 21000]KXW66753.1 MFS transporter [Mycolicibacterium phlei DSM 43239 = CCUG 21000]